MHKNKAGDGMKNWRVKILILSSMVRKVLPAMVTFVTNLKGNTGMKHAAKGRQ